MVEKQRAKLPLQCTEKLLSESAKKIEIRLAKICILRYDLDNREKLNFSENARKIAACASLKKR